MLLARIDEVLPLTCPFGHAAMRSIAFINDASAVRRILDHLGEPTRPPRIAPTRGPPLWEAAAAASNDLAWDHTFPPAPAIEFDQRITWCGATPPSCWVRLGGRRSEREIFLGQDAAQSGSCALANGKMRNLLLTGRRKLTLTTTRPSRILGRGH